MKAIVLTLPVLVFAFAVPAGASQGDRVSVSNPSVFSQQSTCKEGEEWNDETKKCEKKEG